MQLALRSPISRFWLNNWYNWRFWQLNFQVLYYVSKTSTSGRRTADTAPATSAATNWLDGMRCATCMYLLVAISNIFEYLSDRHIITISAFNSRCYQVFYTKKSCLHTPLSCCMRHSSWQLMTEVISEKTFDQRHTRLSKTRLALDKSFFWNGLCYELWRIIMTGGEKLPRIQGHLQSN